MNAAVKARSWILLTLTVLVFVVGLLAAWLSLRPVTFDFDKLGGTILTYEIAPDPEAPEVNGSPLAPLMAESLQRRLDPQQRGEATVVPVGKDRVEIRVPRTGEDHAAAVQRVKELAARPGFLEFLMLANDVDDREAINLAKDMLNAGDDPKLEREIAACHERGLPPPALRPPWAPEVFHITLAGGRKSTVTYRWVELGPSELKPLSLDAAAEFVREFVRESPWQQAKAQRHRALQLISPWHEEKLLQGALFYSRDCQDRSLPEDERRRRGVEYFVLAREPEFETPQATKRTPRIDGSYFAHVQARPVIDDWPSISFTFNEAGGDLFAELTRKNRPAIGEDDAVQVRRHLAIVFDGKVLTAPTINSEIRHQGQITGNFTADEMRTIVDILRGGALPGRLKPGPVSETDVGPKS